MFASPADSPADEGAGIAEDRRARILRRMAWPAAALATAGLIAWLGGCAQEKSYLTSLPFAEWHIVRDVKTDRAAEAHEVPGLLTLNGRGYFVSPGDYGPDFTLAYEYRFPKADSMSEEDRPNCNTGCLLFITGEDKVWPRCLEVQGKWSETASIKSNARDVQVKTTLDESARDAARSRRGRGTESKSSAAAGR